MLTKTITAVLLGGLTSPLYAAQSGASSDAEYAPLFESVPAAQLLDVYPDQAAVQQRNVRVNLDLLGNDDTTTQGPEDGVLINLFDDVEFVGVFQGFEPAYGGGYIAEFDLLGHEDGHAFFSVMNDAVVATIQVGEELYKVNYVGGNQATVSEIDWSLQPGSPDDTSLRIDAGGVEINPGDGNNRRFVDHEIDVMVVYTDNARATNGGESGINALINLAIHETNWSYSRSDVWQRLMLVHTEELNWFEDGDDIGYLTDLKSDGDGVGDEIHALRDEFGADMVSMIYDTGAYCGVAYLMTTLSSTFEEWAFSVIRDSCATGNYTFGHELGHNMGLAHDRANAGSAVTSYAYGWRTTDNAYRSVMAYSPGARIATYSNPNKVAPNGLPMGTATDNNAAALNYTATTVSAFRASRAYGHRVRTTMASNNGWAGNMFNVTPKTDIEVTSFRVNTASTVVETFDVYIREGGYEGYESNAAAWDVWGTYHAVGAGTDANTNIYPGTRSLKAGVTYGIYIDQSSYDAAGDLFRYTNASTFDGDGSFEDNYLRIDTGVGKGEGFAGNTVPDRIWNGAINYRGDAGQVQLETTFASNNGSAGNMFDVEVMNDIVVNSFDVNIDSTAFGAAGTAHVDVWMKTGSYVGSEEDMFAWTYMGSDLATTSTSIDVPVRVAVGDIELEAGQTYAFYMHLASYNGGQRMRYTNGTAGEYVENSDLRIYTGVGKGPLSFGSTFAPRQWNGSINYSGNHGGPHLWLADLAGNQINHVNMAGCTPGTLQYASWSVAGGGPQGSPWGTLYLSNPYFTLPPVAADSNGNVIISTYSPPNASGLQVWVQSLDVGTLQLTNGATLMIQ